jgi:hypothetical protein
MTIGIPRLALAAATLVFGVSIAVAQTAAAPPGLPAFANSPHKNLKVLPQDISGAQLLGTMKFFAQSLGVRCTYCHVGAAGQPPSDFASDANPHKNIARGMIRMVGQINANLPTITGESDSKVTCFTCHRGSTSPATTPTPAAAPPGAPPPPTAAPAKPERGSV